MPRTMPTGKSVVAPERSLPYSGDKITLTTGAGQTVNVVTTPQTTFRRYAPDSVKFSDAKPSSMSELKAGDQARVLGDKTGDAVTAEVVVSGSFPQFRRHCHLR